MSAPVIGITGARMGMWHDAPPSLRQLRTDVFITAYAECVARAGGVPVWVGREASVDALVERLDGVIVAGGQDVDPRRYGAVPGPRATALDPERDGFEIDLVRTAVDRKRPVLGICRGIQLINVTFGGTLVADLPTGDGESHGYLGYPPWHRSHRVDLVLGSRLATLYGPSLLVNSYHHQCVDQLGSGLVAVGRAEDGVIEAIERPGADLLGVQWHPEMLREPEPVFGWLIDRSSALDDSEKHRAIA